MNVAEIMIAFGYKKHTNQLYIRHYFGYPGWFTWSQRFKKLTRRFYYYQLQNYLLYAYCCLNSYYMRFWSKYCIFSLFNILVMYCIWSCS